MRRMSLSEPVYKQSKPRKTHYSAHLGRLHRKMWGHSSNNRNERHKAIFCLVCANSLSYFVPEEYIKTKQKWYPKVPRKQEFQYEMDDLCLKLCHSHTFLILSPISKFVLSSLMVKKCVSVCLLGPIAASISNTKIANLVSCRLLKKYDQNRSFFCAYIIKNNSNNIGNGERK